ncbi:MAG: FkbM family methyltransferase [Patescibacteria group bacterium]|nr:FkbM family methyltransferase [Patescibacteria group bacterium]
MATIMQDKVVLTNEFKKVEFTFTIDPNNLCAADILKCFEHDTPPEPEVVNFLLRAVRPGDHCIDAGANIGFFTLLMAALAGETGHVDAFEPGMNNIPYLKYNLRESGFKNIRAFELALWSKSGMRFSLFLYGHGGYNCLKPIDEIIPDSQDVDTFRLDDMVGVNCSVMKMDIEGAEVEALLGAKNMFDKATVKYCICEINENALNRFGHEAQDLFSFFEQRYYDRFILHFDGRLPSFVSYDWRLKIPRHNTNMLFSRLEWLAELYPELTDG